MPRNSPGLGAPNRGTLQVSRRKRKEGIMRFIRAAHRFKKIFGGFVMPRTIMEGR